VGGLAVSEAKHLKGALDENARPRKLWADAMLEKSVSEFALMQRSIAPDGGMALSRELVER
jgi:hypothetical protein